MWKKGDELFVFYPNGKPCAHIFVKEVCESDNCIDSDALDVDEFHLEDECVVEDSYILKWEHKNWELPMKLWKGEKIG